MHISLSSLMPFLLTSNRTTKQHYTTSITTTTVHPFHSLFSRITRVSHHQKGKSFWILMKQEMTEWHQLDHMQIICTSLQTDNYESTSPLTFYRPDTLPAAQPSVKTLKALTHIHIYTSEINRWIKSTLNILTYILTYLSPGARMGPLLLTCYSLYHYISCVPTSDN